MQILQSEEFTLNKYVVWGTLIILMMGVIILSSASLSKLSLRLDESQSLWQSAHSPGQILFILAQDVHPPLYLLLLHFWQAAFGNDVSANRYFSLLFFLASIPALYYLGTIAYGRREVGLFGAVLCAISPFMNWYGSEIRMYSLLTFLAIVSHALFLLLRKEANAATWALYALVSLLGLYAHYFFILIIVVQFCFFIWDRKNFPARAARGFLVMGTLVAILFVPWIAYVEHLGFARNSQPSLAPPTSVDVFNTFSEFIAGFQQDRLNSLIVSFWPVFVLFLFLALRRKNSVSRETGYFLLAIIIPLSFAILISIAIRPVYVSRYLIFTAPALYLLISRILSLYTKMVRRIFATIIIVSMLVTLGIQTDNAEAPVKENYKGAVEYISGQVRPNDIVLVSAPFTIYPVAYYYNGSARLETLPEWDRTKIGPIPPFSKVTFPADVQRLTKSYRRVWLLLSYDQGYQKDIKDYFDNHYMRLDTLHFSPKLDLYVYKIRYDEDVLMTGGSQPN